MKIFLAGGGDAAQVAAVDHCFAQMLDCSKPVLYIPVAMEPDPEKGYNRCLEWFTGAYQPYGIEKVELCGDLRTAQPDSRYAAVFIGGGNTFALAEQVRASGFDQKLAAYLEAGGILYGGSAGAILCGKTILPAAHLDENAVDLTEFSGLNLLGGWDVWCHYTAADTPLIRAYRGDLLILCESSGLLWEDGRIIPLGERYRTKVGEGPANIVL